MHKLTGRLLRLALSGALALGLATTAIGAAQAVDIKMWNLTNVGYPEYIAMATAEYKKTHPDVNIIFEQFPNEAYKTTIQVALTGRNRPTCSSTGPARMRHGWCARAWRSTSPSRRSARAASSSTSPRAGCLRSSIDGKNYGIPTDAVSKYFYYDKAFFAEHKLEIADDVRRAARAVQGDPGHRSGDRSLAAGQLGALEAQPRHHHAERARARRRGDRCGLRADRARRPALHQPGLCRSLAEGGRPQGGRLLPGRAERHLAGSQPLDVRLAGVAR